MFSQRFYSTYEELKPFFLSSKNLAASNVFTVPMRNWNFYYFLDPNINVLCFYSTYEELKHVRLPRINFCIPGFYSTYEELKQPLESSFFAS